MSTIITPGFLNVPEKEIETQCPRCRCIFRFQEREASREQQGRSDWLKIKCPQDGCGYTVYYAK